MPPHASNIWELFPSFLGTERERLYRRVMAERVPASVEVKGTLSDRWYRMSIYPAANGVSVLLTDITERKRAEEALRASEERYRNLFETMTEGVSLDEIVYDEKGQPCDVRFLKVNPAFERQTGLRAEDVVGRTSRELFGRAEPIWLERYARVVATGVPDQFEATFGPLGRRFVVSACRTEGRCLAVISFDVTERRSAEEALRESESRFRSVLDASRDVIYRLNLQSGRYEYVSPSARTVVGFSAEEFMAMDVETGLRMIHADDAPAMRAAVAHLEELGEAEVEYRQRTKEGDYRWLSNRMSLVRDANGRPLYRNGNIRDVTERKRAEAALRGSEERLRSVLENMSEGLVMFDGNGTITYQNPASEHIHDGRLTGQRRRLDQLAVNWRVRKYPDGDVVPSDQWAIPRILRGERVLHERFFVDSLDDPERSYVGVYSGCPAYDKGKLAYGFLTIEDITEQARAEGALRQVNETLREADQRKNEFSGVLSHELRNPLTPIRNSLHILDRTRPGGEEARRAHTVIDRQVSHLTRLVDDLLDATRISRGKIRLQRTHMDLVDEVHRTIEDHRSLLQNHAVTVELPNEAIWIDGDPTRLAQVLGNLLNNAAKFTPEDGKISVSLYRTGSHAVLEVADTGLGIDSETHKRLFEPFAQADRSLDRSRGGLGLGLALVKGMVELHGGEVSVYSDGPGKGARFTITLPLEAPVAVTADSAQTHAVTRSASRRVLVIEDNMDAADSLSEVLELAGHRVVVTYNGEAGLAKAREFCPDVILCDIGLSGTMDGYAVASALRSGLATASAYLIALTGYAQPDDQRRAWNVGFDAHLAKPPDIAALERLLTQAPSHRAVDGAAPPTP